MTIKSRMPAARKTNRASHSGEMLSFVSKQSISGTQTAAPPPVSEAAVVRDLSSRGCRGLGLSPEQAAGTPACTRSCASPFGGCVSALCVCCVQGAVPGPWRLGGQDPAGACGWGVGIGKGQRVGSGRRNDQGDGRWRRSRGSEGPPALPGIQDAQLDDHRSNQRAAHLQGLGRLSAEGTGLGGLDPCPPGAILNPGWDPGAPGSPVFQLECPCCGSAGSRVLASS